MSLIRIISGGQTGVDRAALDASLDCNFACGGWCPEGRLAEDGVIHEKYPLIEIPGRGYNDRTLKNVLNSDATLVICIGKITGGTKLTVKYLKDHKKPLLLVNAELINIDDALLNLIDFINFNKVEILNVAGPRISSHQDAYNYTYKLLKKFLLSIAI